MYLRIHRIVKNNRSKNILANNKHKGFELRGEAGFKRKLHLVFNITLSYKNFLQLKIKVKHHLEK